MDKAISNVTFYVDKGSVDEYGNPIYLQVKINYSPDGILDPTQPQDLIDAIESATGGEVIGYSIKGGQDFTHYLYESGEWAEVDADTMESNIYSDPEVFNDNDLEGTWNGRDLDLEEDGESESGGGRGPKQVGSLKSSSVEVEGSDSDASQLEESEPEEEAKDNDDQAQEQNGGTTHGMLASVEYEIGVEGPDQPDETEEDQEELEESEFDQLEELELAEQEEQQDEAEMDGDDATLSAEEELVVFTFDEPTHWIDGLTMEDELAPDGALQDWTQGTEVEQGLETDHFGMDFDEPPNAGDDDADDQVDW